MKRRIAYVILTLSVAALIICIFFGRDIFEFAEFIKSLDDDKKVMNSAKEYMDSLTDKDIQAWIQRAKMDLKDPPTNFDVDTGPFPPDLQKLGITGIEEGPDEVDYMWLGGMDDTALAVERMSNGDFQVIAVYTPYSNRIIWPRQAP